MKTRPALRDSAWSLVHEILQSWGVKYYTRESTLDIVIGKSEMHFRGMDNPEKLKSTEYNQIWMEEATEFTYDDFVNLKLRLSAMPLGHRNQLMAVRHRSSGDCFVIGLLRLSDDAISAFCGFCCSDEDCCIFLGVIASEDNQRGVYRCKNLCDGLRCIFRRTVFPVGVRADEPECNRFRIHCFLTECCPGCRVMKDILIRFLNLIGPISGRDILYLICDDGFVRKCTLKGMEWKNIFASEYNLFWGDACVYGVNLTGKSLFRRTI